MDPVMNQERVSGKSGEFNNYANRTRGISFHRRGVFDPFELDGLSFLTLFETESSTLSR